MTITKDQIFLNPPLDTLNGLLDPKLVKRATEIRLQNELNEKLKDLHLDINQYNSNDRNAQALRRFKERLQKRKKSNF